MRIEEMIRAEKLAVVSSAPEDGPSYDRILKKGSEDNEHTVAFK